MASDAHTMPVPAMQPGLPAFIVYASIPAGCSAYPVTDNTHAPLLRAGEWVVADAADREPAEGELFMCQWQSGRSGPQVVECGIMPKLTEKRGEPIWAVGARHRRYNAKALGFGSPGDIVGDFGYRSPQLTERFLGRVIGIFQPTFAEPALAVAGGLN